MICSQTALTKNGYSEDTAWKPLTHPGDNADVDAAGSPDVKRAPLWSMWYDVRSLPHPCVKKVEIQVYHGNKSYKRYECNTHSLLCVGYGNIRGRCEPSGYEFIPELNKSVKSGCKCKED